MMEQDYLLGRWPVIRNDLMDLIDQFEEEDLIYVPVKEGWCVGEIMLHIGEAAEFWLHSGILNENNVLEDGRVTLENFPTKTVIKAYLAAEHAMTMELLSDFPPERWNACLTHHDGEQYTPAWIFWHVLEHEVHHRGELSLIAGILGREGLDV
jgi:uncharacterized damage-inducible protein DinB